MAEVNRGSEWRKWDLHIHTASSFDYEYKDSDCDELLVKAWREHGFQAVAITDHFKIDSKRIKLIKEFVKDEITVFPGVELRTDKGGTNIHVILIFSEEIDIDELAQDFESIMLRQKSKPNSYTDQNVYWDYKDIVEFAKTHDGLISIHAGKKSNGLDKMITNALEVSMAVKAEYAETVDIFEGSKKQDLIDYQNHVFKSIDERPVIVCSDNHDPRKYLIKDYLWIKADPTFSGLKQAIIHPRERVYIGEEPQKVESLRKNPEKYISGIKVRKKDVSRNQDKWFDFDIDLNIGLTTVIGNKGSGKSAFADLLGYLGKSENQEHFSFLSKERFAKEDKKFNLDYEGEITWYDNEVHKMVDFSLNSDGFGVPLIRYLPQRYIEETCNSLGQKFQNEIDNVIFSYVDIDKRGSSTNLKELVENKQVGLLKSIDQIKLDLSLINEDIIKLERKRSSNYKKQCKDNLEHWSNELARHEANKPKEVLQPEDSDNNQEELNFIAKYNDMIVENNELIKTNQQKINNERVCIEELNTYLGEIELIHQQILDLRAKGVNISEKYDILPYVEVTFEVQLEGLKNRIDEADKKIDILNELVSKSYVEDEIQIDDGALEAADNYFSVNEYSDARVHPYR